jgi:hypothetical protein
MLIWGSTVREKETAQGQFFCPHYCDLKPYRCKKISRYFTLISIPLFETQKLSKVVECQICQSSYDTSILDPKSQVIFKVLAAARYDLRQGMPLAETKSKLLAMGVGDDVADMVIKMVQQ